MTLYNLLQANGGVARLSWGEPIRSGPDQSPDWTIYAFRQSLNGRAYSHLTPINS